MALWGLFIKFTLLHQDSGLSAKQRKAQKACPPHTEANSETSFVETAVAYAREQVPGVKL